MRPLLLVLGFAASAAAQSTWIVDDTPGPGVHFTSLPAAVAAAASGDTLLVGAGSYEPFQVAGKALSIRGAGSGATLLDQAPPAAAADYVAIDAVPAGAVFRLFGVSVRRTHPQRLVLRGSGPSQGAVVLDDVVSGPPATATPGPDGPALLVRNLLVHVHRCEFTGGSTPFSGAGHVGVLADTGAVLVADECTILGGAGTAFNANASGADGLVVDGATCRLSGCTVRGGDAGILGIGYLGRTGNGLRAVGAAVVTVAGTAADVIAGGSTNATYSLLGSGIDSSPPGIVVVHGAVTISGGTSGIAVGPPTTGGSITVGLPPLPRLRFAGTALGNGALQAAQPITLSLDHAPPAQLFVLLADLHPGAGALPGLSAEPLLVSPAAAIASFGLLDAAGEHTLTAVPATQLPYVVGLASHWQGFVWDPVLGRWLGSNGALLRVEP